MKNKAKKGFTLAELLIVVAIIAVLVAVAIPVLSSQLEKSKEATDAANIRAQYAAVMVKAIGNSGDVNKDGADSEFGKIQLKQSVDGWATKGLEDSLGSIMVVKPGAKPLAQATAWVEYVEEEDKVYLCYGDGSGSEVSGVVDWSTQPLQNAGQKMIASLKSKPGTNHITLYSSNSEQFSDDEKTIVSEIKKYISLGDDYAVYYDWSGYPGIRCTVTTSVTEEGVKGPFEYVNRISFDKNGTVTKVVKEYGAWDCVNNVWGFFSRSTVNGVNYPTETLYEK